MTDSRRRFESSSVLVFGAASGIGAAAARQFANEGAQVMAFDLHVPTDAGADVLPVRPCDVTSETQVRAAVDSVLVAHGRIDVLVNAAGVIRNDEAGSIRDEAWDLMHEVNLRGTMRTLRAVLPHMAERGRGSVVNIASVAAFNAGADAASYAASKAGVVALTRSAAQRYGGCGIRINALCPGWVDTPMSEREMRDLAQSLSISVEDARRRTVERIALGRMASPDEMATVCLFLASEDASFVTGAALVADGGTRISAAMRAV